MGASPPPTMASTDFNPIEPSVLEANANGVLLFSKWDPSEVEVKDISLTDYIQVRNPVLLPHTAGRYATKQFRKAQMPIVERLVNSLMMNGRNNGKKQMVRSPLEPYAAA